MPAKKIGVVPYSIFKALDKIREEHDISSRKWAEASGLDAPRVTEFRKEKKHRVFTYDKAVALAAGIRKLTGRDIVRKELKKRIDEVDTYREKAVLLLLLGFEDDNDPRIKHIYENMQLLQYGSDEE